MRITLSVWVNVFPFDRSTLVVVVALVAVQSWVINHARGRPLCLRWAEPLTKLN